MPVPGDVAALCAGAERAQRRLELAFFGGSFTCIGQERMRPLLEAAAPFLGHVITGIRISTRPDAVDGEILAFLRRYGVTAIELGAQSMDDRVLQLNGRGHTARQVEEAARRIREAGFELGLQMMLGLDGSTAEDDLDTARRLIACAPDTMRIYPTLVLRGTALERRMRAGRYRPLSLEEAVERTVGILELLDPYPGIRLIRIGLHPSASLEERLIAGPYHPAFRELCEGALMQQRLLGQIGRPAAGKTVLAAVAPGELSRMLGHRRCNALALRQQGVVLRVLEREGISPLHPQLVSIS